MLFSTLTQAVNTANRGNDLMQIYKKVFNILNVREQLAQWIEQQKWCECADHIESLLTEDQSTVVEPNTIARDLVQEFIYNIECVIANSTGTMKINLTNERDAIKMYSANTVVKKMTECLKQEDILYEKITDPKYEQTADIEIERRMNNFKEACEKLKHTGHCLGDSQTTYSFMISKIQKAMRTNLSSENLERLEEYLKQQKCSNEFISQYQVFLHKATSCEELSKVAMVELMDMLETYKYEVTLYYIHLQKEEPSCDTLRNWLPKFGKLLHDQEDDLHHAVNYLSYYNNTDHTQAIDATPITLLYQATKERFQELLKRSFLVVSQIKNPCIKVKGGETGNSTRTFSASVQALASEDITGNVRFDVAATFESEDQPGVTITKLGTTRLERKPHGGMSADFTRLTINNMARPKKRRTNPETDVYVFERRYHIRFTTQITIGNDTIQLEAVSLPLFIITNTSQECDCLGTLLWQCYDTDAHREPHHFPETLQWGTVAEMLSRKFEYDTERGLNLDQRRFLGSELAGVGEDLVSDEMEVTWAQFNKIKPRNRKMKFWEWIDGILKLVTTHLLQPWNEGLIHGFVSAKFINSLAMNDCIPDNSYIFRFSTSLKSTVNIDIVSRGMAEGKCPSSRYEMDEFNQSNLGKVVKKTKYRKKPLMYLYCDGKLRPTDDVFEMYYAQTESRKTDVDSSQYVTYVPRRIQTILDECDDMSDEEMMLEEAEASPKVARCSSESSEYMSGAQACSPSSEESLDIDEFTSVLFHSLNESTRVIVQPVDTPECSMNNFTCVNQTIADVDSASSYEVNSAGGLLVCGLMTNMNDNGRPHFSSRSISCEETNGLINNPLWHVQASEPVTLDDDRFGKMTLDLNDIMKYTT